MKRIATMQDLSCVGKCSLTVALPILSAMGIETCPIPTAVLSANSAFSGFTFRELTKDIPSILHHWEKIGMRFDAIYVGYLGNARQAEPVRQLLSVFGDDHRSLKIIDPAMADNGKLYRGVSSDMIGAMRRLVNRADVITPNLTEACLLTGTMYREDMNKEEIGDLMLKLSQLGGTDSPAAADESEASSSPTPRRNVILTGMSLHEGEVGAVCYDALHDSFHACYNEQIPGHFHGTGDIFSSVVTGALTLGKSLQDATRLAVDFTYESIRRTLDIPQEKRTGVAFEKAIPLLIP